MHPNTRRKKTASIHTFTDQKNPIRLSKRDCRSSILILILILLLLLGVAIRFWQRLILVFGLIILGRRL